MRAFFELIIFLTSNKFLNLLLVLFRINKLDLKF